MKILHINTVQYGGAAWCAIRINHSLKQRGVESKMLFAQGKNLPEGVDGAIAKQDKIVHYRNNWLVSKIRHLMMRLPFYMNVEKLQTLISDKNVDKVYVHHPLSNYTNIAEHPLVKWADIIHLHWVPGFIDYPSFFKAINKPIVWTMHDMYPALGIMHYQSAFTKCPDSLKSIDEYCANIKKKSLQHSCKIHFVAISKMVERMCRQSCIIKKYDTSLIYNGIDGCLFDIHDRIELRRSFFCANNLDSNSKIFLFSSYEIWDKRKGLSRVIDALERVECNNKVLVVIGNNKDDISPKASFRIVCTGLIKEQTKLAEYYSCADFFISASFEETFGQTITEAMACGCPVVATPTGVAPDIMREFNGVLCGDFDVKTLSDSISIALTREYNPKEIRQFVIEKFEYGRIADQYIDLYKSLLKS